jgi:hypothetical protein
LQQPDAELEFELICREWDIPLEKPPMERAPEQVSHDIYSVPDAPGTVPSRRRRRAEAVRE